MGRILDMISDAIIIINRDRTIEHANKAFLDLRRNTPTEVVGSPCYQVTQGRTIDRVMPGMSGDRLFMELKRLNPSIKAVISSGYFEEDREELMKLGFSAFLNKPFNMEQLVKTVSMFLS